MKFKFCSDPCKIVIVVKEDLIVPVIFSEERGMERKILNHVSDFMYKIS